MSSISDVTCRNSATSEECEATTQQLYAHTSNLKDMLNKFT